MEDDVYATLSNRFGDIFSVLGQLPNSFEDEWIDAVLRDRRAVKNFSQRVEKARPLMELRYMRDVADDNGLDWEYTERVLSSRDLDEWMRQGWRPNLVLRARRRSKIANQSEARAASLTGPRGFRIDA